MSAQDVWEFNLKRALLLVKELRFKSFSQNIDPRATRVALKFALLVDTFCSKEAGLTEEDDRRMDILVQKLWKDTLRG